MAHVIKTMQDTLPKDPWHGYYAAPAVAGGADRQGRARPEDQGRHLPQGGQGDPGARSGGAGLPRVRPARSCREVAGDPQDQEPGREVRQAARLRRIRRRSSSGRSSATCSTTAPSTWPTSPTLRATSISPSAGATAGRRARSRPGRPPAGRRSPRPWTADIVAGKTMSSAPLPAWVFDGRRRACRQRLVLRAPKDIQTALDAARLPAPALPRARASGRCRPIRRRRARRFGENDGVRLWRLPHVDATSPFFPSRPRCTRSATTCSTACSEAIAVAEHELQGPRHLARSTVLGRRQPAGSARRPGPGRQVRAVRTVRRATSSRRRMRSSTRWCRSSRRCAAWRWAAAASSRCTARARVVALEGYIGLVEAGVGLMPAGGGCKEFAMRAAKGHADRRTTRPSTSSSRCSRPSRWPRSRRARSRPRELGFVDDCRHRRLQRARAAPRRAAPGARDWPKPATPAAAGAQHPGRGRRRHRHAQDDAGQHEGRAA